MSRLRRLSVQAAGVLILFAGLPGSSFDSRAGRADDPQPAAPKVNAPTPAAAARTAASRTTAAAQSRQKHNTALKTQRALARRADIALEDQYGPGAASMALFGRNSGSFGSTGFLTGPFSTGGLGSSLGFGGSSGLGGSTMPGMPGGSPAAGGIGSGTGTGGGAGGTPGQSGGTSTEAPDLNRRVLEFALQNMGQQVGNGQCWMLGSEALAYAGAEPPHGQVFGEAVPLAQALPGDILEFYNVHLVGAGYWMSLGTPYHTAIVYSTRGTSITMLNQNVNHVLKVQSTVIDLADLVSGTVTVYRPVARSSN